MSTNSRRAIAKMQGQVDVCKKTVLAYLLMIGERWEEVTPSRKSTILVQRFKFFASQFERLLSLKDSPERNLALKLTHDRLRRITAEIEDGNELAMSVGGGDKPTHNQ